MPRHTSRASRAVVVLCVAGAVSLGAGAALAAAQARTAATVPATAASWGAGVAVPGAAPNGPYVVAWTSPPTPRYLDVVNTGTAKLVSMTLSGQNSQPSNGTAPPEIGVDACVGAVWNAAANSCAGTVVRLGATSGGSFVVTTTTVPAAGGARLSIRATAISVVNFPNPFTTALSVTTARNQVRAATTTSG